MATSSPTGKALSSIHVAFALALLFPVSTLQAQPAAGNQPVPRVIRPNGSQECKPVLVQAWCGEAGASGTDSAPKGLPGDWATPALKSNDEPLVRQSEKVSPDAMAEPRAVSTDANPPPQLDQAMLEGVRVRLRNLGLLGLTDVSDTSLAEAVRRFQASINIPETGVLNRDTLGRLLVP